MTIEVGSWAYAGGRRRDLRIDTLRGFAALAMIADHVGGGSWLVPLTGGNRFLVSAAEAFVFISGLVMGIVYSGIMRTGFTAGLRKVLIRAGKLYLLTVCLTVSFATTAILLGLPWKPDLSQGGPIAFLFDVATLRRTLFLTDIPLLYTLLLVLSIPVLFLLRRGRWPAVLAGSWLLWAAWQLWPGTFQLPWHIRGNSLFNLPAWQVIFVTGVVAGYKWSSLERWVARLPRRALLCSLAVMSMAVLALYLLQLTSLGWLRADRTVYALGFDKPDVPIARLATLALLMSVGYAALTVAWAPASRLTTWLLLPLGQQPLTAYSVHIFVVAATAKATTTVFGGHPTAAAATLIQVGAILLVWLIVRTAVIKRAELLTARRLGSAIAGVRQSDPSPRRLSAAA